MSFKSAFLAACLAVTTVSPALAQDIMISDAYARSASKIAKSGAAFLVIENHGPADRLLSVASPAAARVQLHTHSENADGVMSMRHVEDGFDLPMHGRIEMGRGGDHVMFMGLTAPFVDGEMIPLTLIFETAGEIVIEVPVDLHRRATHSMDAGHSHDSGD